MASTKRIYGLDFPKYLDPLAVEMAMVRKGGRWKGRNGQMYGEGMFFHFKKVLQMISPETVWHKWIDLIVEHYCDPKNRTIAIMGPSSSGKSYAIGLCVYGDYSIFPDCTTVSVCSSTREVLEDKVWGEIKKVHKLAKRLYSWLPGHLIEGRLRIVTDSRDDVEEGRDFKNGLIGRPCKLGSDTKISSDFIGIHNKRIRVVADDLHTLPASFIHIISNVDKAPDAKVIGSGNPCDTMDALGQLGEPAAHLGGWDGGIDQTPGTKTWEARRKNGICIQLYGEDSPNLDGKLGCGLISQEAIDRDISFYGTDSVNYTQMNLGMMPRGLGSKRVLTRQLCQKFRALDEPNWLDSNRTRIGFLDAAYGGVGGDRCIFGELQFGREADLLEVADLAAAVISQSAINSKRRLVLCLIETVLVPVSVKLADLPCDQIVDFCRSECESRHIPPENFFYDAGMRSALVNAFGRLWSNSCNAIDCGGTASDRKVSGDIDVVAKDYYANKITEMWYSVRLVVEAGQWRGMSQEVLQEFCQREWGQVGKNKIQVEPKADMKKKTGRSPDLADAVAIGVAGAIERGFLIERLKSARQAVRDDRWKRELREKASNLRPKQLNHAG